MKCGALVLAVVSLLVAAGVFMSRPEAVAVSKRRPMWEDLPARPASVVLKDLCQSYRVENGQLVLQGSKTAG